MPQPTVLLRPLAVADAEVLAAWGADEVFSAHAGWKPSATEREALARWQALIARPDPELLRLAALHHGHVVGYVDLYDDQAGGRELGYVIGPSRRWGQGLGTAAARAGLAHGFGSLALPRIWAEAIEANTASLRVLQRLGMREIGGGEAEAFLGRPSRYRRFEIHRNHWLAGLDPGASETASPAPPRPLAD